MSTAPNPVLGYTQSTEVTGYNHAYQPTGTQIVIPDSEGELAGTYAYEHGYTKETGLPFWTKAPPSARSSRNA
ncbi:hypothetical protein [Streptomyces paromomycinus]|uniref:hypothetical protein n=1 Tax=Streptomyces paromomycinus TaxID=92743 RepID=UPI001479058E|nr:hypothetical protein [Streptomyces paromomycinus]